MALLGRGHAFLSGISEMGNSDSNHKCSQPVSLATSLIRLLKLKPTFAREEKTRCHIKSIKIQNFLLHLKKKVKKHYSHATKKAKTYLLFTQKVKKITYQTTKKNSSY